MQIINETSPKLEQFVAEFNNLLERYQYDMVTVLEYNNSSIVPAVRMIDVPPKEQLPTNPPEPTIETPMETPVFPGVDGGVPDGQ